MEYAETKRHGAEGEISQVLQAKHETPESQGLAPGEGQGLESIDETILSHRYIVGLKNDGLFPYMVIPQFRDTHVLHLPALQ